MKSISDYLIWLYDLEEKESRPRTRESIGRLISLLNTLEKRRVFDNYPYEFFKRLEIMRYKVEAAPDKAGRIIDAWIKGTSKTLLKLYDFVPSGYYRGQYAVLGGSISVVFSFLTYAASHNIAYMFLALFIIAGLALSAGYLMDMKALREGRVLVFSAAHAADD